MSPLPPFIQRLEALFAARTGIDLGRGLTGPALARFVSSRTAQLGLPSVEAYVDALETGEPPELARLINAATVGLTWFFRDADQLESVAQLLRELPAHGRPLEIWVAGCSTGEDVYSLAMLAESVGKPAAILGTDLNSDSLVQAERAVYSHWSCRNVPPAFTNRLLPVGDRYEVAAPLRRNVRFRRHNLIDPPPPPRDKPGWDLVLCRNVLIYFFPQQASITVGRMAGALSPGGWLVLGANEILHYQTAQLQLQQVSARWVLRRLAEPTDALPVAAPSVARVPEPITAQRVAPSVDAPPSEQSDPEVLRLLRLANERHVAGQLAGALELYAEVLARDTLCAEARMFFGIAQFKTGDHAAAVRSLRAALFLEPELWPAAFYLALSLEKLSNHAEATREYRRVVEFADHPLKLSSTAIDQLDVWKDEVVRLALDRSGRAR